MAFLEVRVFDNEHEPGSKEWEMWNKCFIYFEIHYQMKKLVGDISQIIDRYNEGGFAASGAKGILVYKTNSDS